MCFVDKLDTNLRFKNWKHFEDIKCIENSDHNWRLHYWKHFVDIAVLSGVGLAQLQRWATLPGEEEEGEETAGGGEEEKEVVCQCHHLTKWKTNTYQNIQDAFDFGVSAIS